MRNDYNYKIKGALCCAPETEHNIVNQLYFCINNKILKTKNKIKEVINTRSGLWLIVTRKEDNEIGRNPHSASRIVVIFYFLH